jgi:HNH endonuclease
MPTRSPYPKQGTIKIIQQRLRDGSLVVDLKTGEVYSVKPPGIRRRIVPFETDGYLYVSIWKRVRHRNGSVSDYRRGVSVGVLVWMAAHNGRAVPRGCEIHHDDRNTKHNWYSNLKCLTRKRHKEIHRKQDEASDYFQALAENF